MNPRPNRPMPKHRGVILVLSAFLMVFMLGLIAFAVDMGYIANVRTDMQRATDAAAFAGAGALVNGTVDGANRGDLLPGQNKVGRATLGPPNATIEFGYWNIDHATFTVTSNQPNAIRVYGQRPRNSRSSSARSSASRTSRYRPVGRHLPAARHRHGARLLGLDVLRQPVPQHQPAGPSRRSKPTCSRSIRNSARPTFGTLDVHAGQVRQHRARAPRKVKKQFKLNNVAYPYPGGSWDEYIDYVQDDSYIDAAGYRNDYGYMTWINYMLAKQPSSAATPGLWNVSEQPVTALKDAVDVFLVVPHSHTAPTTVSACRSTPTPTARPSWNQR